MNDTDKKFLRTAFRLAREARRAGNGAFGAVLADRNGKDLLRAENTAATDRDPTAHAEMNLLRRAFAVYDREFLQSCTLYTSAEPCLMCAGAIYWSGLGRVVFGMSVGRQAELTAEDQDVAPLIGCRELIAKGSKDDITISGPHLEDEAARVFSE